MGETFAQIIGAGFREPDKITTHVTRHLAKRAVISDYDLRGVGAIHPSEASKMSWCPRSTYYRITGAPAQEVIAGIAMEVIYAIGEDSGKKWQGWFWEMGVLRGTFHCLWCNLYFEAVSPNQCPRCETFGLLEYKEVSFSNDEYMLAGQADGDVFLNDRWRLVENKTINPGTARVEAPSLYLKHCYSVVDEEGRKHSGVDLPALWKDIRRPFVSHLRQGMIYCFCAERKEITFLYEPKFITSPPKEFEIKFDRSIIADVLDSCLTVKKAVDAGRPPKRPLELEPTSDVCKKCAYRKTCWGDRIK